MKPITNQAYQLLHEGCIALSQVEANGIRIDVDYLKRTLASTKKDINKLTTKLKSGKIYKRWKEEYKYKTKLGSRAQLGHILFDIMDYECLEETDTGRAKTDEAALKTVDIPFVRRYLKLEKLKKARNTYLKNIRRETFNGFMHPFFNLHLALTYRSSSDHPNFQNIPIKNPYVAELIRRAFIARKNHQLIETDFKGIEVCCATCYHHDPNMIIYLSDTKKNDMHRDAACDCLMIKKSQVSWNTRDIAKNMFIFPQFYGDWHKHCAANLWNAIVERHICTEDGVYLIKHLKRKGITELGNCDPDEDAVEGTFEYHIKEVEYDFWNEKFPVYHQWKQDWYEAYLKKGYFETLTGFIIEGMMKRNEVINYPVQGSAFHWLLWALIRIQKLLKKYRMKSLLVGQIHDSIVGDVHKREKRDYLNIVRQVIYEDLPKHWKWIIVPLSVETKVAPVGGSWFDIKEEKI